MNPDTVIQPHWPAPPGVCSLVTTRRGGVSEGPWASLNMGDHVGDNPAHVAENRQRLTAYLAGCQSLVWLEQVHGVNVVELGENIPPIPPQADGVWTSVASSGCAIMTADCLPVLFCDVNGSRVGAAHAGWRGLAAGILNKTIDAMGVNPADILAYLGPAIGPGAFEVGNDVQQAFMGCSQTVAHKQHIEACFKPVAAGKWLADLYGLARVELHSIGVKAIYGGDFCTYTEEQRFYSYRRDGITGRMASLIWLNDSV